MSSSEKGGWSLRSHLATRLALGIGSTLAIVLFVLDYRIDTGVYEHLDNMLSMQARAVASGLRQEAGQLSVAAPPGYDLPDHTDYFALFGPGDELVLISPNSDHNALPPPPPSALLPLYYDVRSPDGHRARALAVALDVPSTGHKLVVATERADWDASERQIHRSILATIAVATGIVVVLTLLIVHGAFVPLMRHGARLARLDTDVRPQSLGSDLPKELAPFAAAVDAGITRLYGAIERERRFSRDIAHEFRTPLAEIRATAEVALRDGDEAVLRNGLETAISTTQRLQRSVDTLLALARFESGQESPALDPLDLAAVIAVQIEALRHLSDARQIAVRVNGPASAWVHSDIGIIERILSNLLQNAIDYAPHGSRVDCELRRAGDGYLLSIGNEAPGLDVEDISRFGSRFWRKHVEGGTAHHAGLGLALCFALARSLGVELTFELRGARLQAKLGPFPAL